MGQEQHSRAPAQELGLLGELILARTWVSSPSLLTPGTGQGAYCPRKPVRTSVLQKSQSLPSWATCSPIGQNQPQHQGFLSPFEAWEHQSPGRGGSLPQTTQHASKGITPAAGIGTQRRSGKSKSMYLWMSK
jgi:hypothetical protein